MNALRIVPLVLAAWLPACSWLVGDWAGAPETKSQKDQIIFSHKRHIVGESLSCSDCHPDVKTSDSLRDGRHIPTEKTCTECHDKADNCKQCHANPSLPVTFQGDDKMAGLNFSHSKHMARSLPGDASPVSCDACHGNVKDAERVSQDRRPAMFEACGQCHQQDFKADACARCHVNGTPHGKMSADIFDHGGDWLHRHGVAAQGADQVCAHCHKPSACTECHGRANVPIRPAQLRLDRPDGMGQHRGDWLTRHSLEARLDGKSCLACHQQSSCVDCHGRAGVGSIGKGNKNTPHPAQWLNRGGSDFHGDAAWREPAQCAACHDKGAASNCVQCHKVGGSGGNPHPPGWQSPQDKLRAPGCVACHL